MDEKDNKEEPQVQGPEAAEDAEDDAPLQGSWAARFPMCATA